MATADKKRSKTTQEDMVAIELYKHFKYSSFAPLPKKKLIKPNDFVPENYALGFYESNALSVFFFFNSCGNFPLQMQTALYHNKDNLLLTRFLASISLYQYLARKYREKGRLSRSEEQMLQGLNDYLSEFKNSLDKIQPKSKLLNMLFFMAHQIAGQLPNQDKSDAEQKISYEYLKDLNLDIPYDFWLQSKDEGSRYYEVEIPKENYQEMFDNDEHGFSEHFQNARHNAQVRSNMLSIMQKYLISIRNQVHTLRTNQKNAILDKLELIRNLVDEKAHSAIGYEPDSDIKEILNDLQEKIYQVYHRNMFKLLNQKNDFFENFFSNLNSVYYLNYVKFASHKEKIDKYLKLSKFKDALAEIENILLNHQHLPPSEYEMIKCHVFACVVNREPMVFERFSTFLKRNGYIEENFSEFLNNFRSKIDPQIAESHSKVKNKYKTVFIASHEVHRLTLSSINVFFYQFFNLRLTRLTAYSDAITLYKAKFCEKAPKNINMSDSIKIVLDHFNNILRSMQGYLNVKRFSKACTDLYTHLYDEVKLNDIEILDFFKIIFKDFKFSDLMLFRGVILANYNKLSGEKEYNSSPVSLFLRALNISANLKIELNEKKIAYVPEEPLPLKMIAAPTA